MEPKKDNTFCYFPFSQLALKTWVKGKGIESAAQCCNAIRPNTPDPLGLNDAIVEKKLNPSDIFNSKSMQDIRDDMINGKRPEACNTCWEVESNGSKSYRLFSRPPGAYDGYLDFDYTDPKLQSIDFGFGENCNLRCRMCQPNLSNKLRHDFKFFVDNNIDTEGVHGWDHREMKPDPRFDELNIIADDKTIYDMHTAKTGHNDVWYFEKNEQWQNILDNIHDLRTIKCTGGETTLTQGFQEFVDYAIEVGAAKNLVLEFHTNATKFTDTLVEKMTKFKHCHLSFSIDSVEKNYEYIRYPMKFDTLTNSVNNLISKWYKKFDDAPFRKKISIDLTSVFMSYNAHYLYDLYHWWKYTLYSLPSDLIHTSFYIDKLWPEDKFINVTYLGKKQKLEILEILYKIQNDGLPNVEVEHIIQFVKESLDDRITDDHRLRMLKEISIFDQSRNQDYHDYLHPSIIEFLDTPIKD